MKRKKIIRMAVNIVRNLVDIVEKEFLKKKKKEESHDSKETTLRLDNPGTDISRDGV